MLEGFGVTNPGGEAARTGPLGWGRAFMKSLLVSRYRQAVRRYFRAEWSGSGPLPPTVWDRLVELTTGHSPREGGFVLDRIRFALFNPRALGLRRSREAASPSPAPQRAPRVRTTLARGAHTQDPSAPYR